MFAPRAGMILEGIVSKVSSSHLSLLSYGVFNASISASNGVNDDSFTFEDTLWCGGNNNENITVGTSVKFIVLHVQNSDVKTYISMYIFPYFTYDCVGLFLCLFLFIFSLTPIHVYIILFYRAYYQWKVDLSLMLR